MNLGSDYRYCEGCSTHYVDTGCGQDKEHTRCPLPCSICGKPITGRKGPDDCQSHTFDEARAFDAARRGRTS